MWFFNLICRTEFVLSNLEKLGQAADIAINSAPTVLSASADDRRLYWANIRMQAKTAGYSQ